MLTFKKGLFYIAIGKSTQKAGSIASLNVTAYIIL